MRLLEFVIGLLTKSVPVGVFFLKFLNWWHSDEHTRVTAAITRLPAPPPPDPLQVSNQSITKNVNHNLGN